MSKPTYAISSTGGSLSGDIDISVSTNHSASTGTATIRSISVGGLDLGDKVTIDLGYDSVNSEVFTGYVKQWDFSEAENTYTITLNDSIIRAIDYYIVSSDPETPFTRNNIQLENLVHDLLGLCGLTNTYMEETFFHLQTNQAGGIEINQVSVYDYCKQLGDIVTWTLWADSNELIHFENRKPYVMTGAQPEFPGDKVDVPLSTHITDDIILDLGYNKNEANLRNRVVVYGDNVQAEAKVESPYLPDGFYKSVLIAFPMLITTQEEAQKCADYNLDKLNRLTEVLLVTVVGDPIFEARKVVTMESTVYPEYNGNWYIYSCDHNFSNNGFITKMELRK